MKKPAQTSGVFLDEFTGTQMVLTGVEEQPGYTLRYGPSDFADCIEWVNKNPLGSLLTAGRNQVSKPAAPTVSTVPSTTPDPVSIDNRTWTLWRHTPSDVCFLLPSSIAAESHCRPLVQSSALQECLAVLKKEHPAQWNADELRGLHVSRR